MTMEILDKLGEDLAVYAQQQKMPIADLLLDEPRIGTLSLLDRLLALLSGPMNCAFLVSDNIEFLNAYVNGLAVLMSQPESLIQTIRNGKRMLEEVSEGLTDRIVQRLSGKRLYTFGMDKFIAMGKGRGDEVWDKLFEQVIQDAHENHYILVIDNIHHLFRQEGAKDLKYPARYVDFASRGVAKLTFIAPLTWLDYANDIESGIFPMIVRTCRPLLFTPRPTGLPKTILEKAFPKWVPDGGFTFNS